MAKSLSERCIKRLVPEKYLKCDYLFLRRYPWPCCLTDLLPVAKSVESSDPRRNTECLPLFVFECSIARPGNLEKH